ncbi:All-trans-phytoene synthase [Novipirellula aureliae]|uniref:All-trans-phytoene synthase n=2 Tax=Novipirellula aureliae TaxID=2527966 RepID=A0A5C6DXN7_9BACT|nr:All-trans-phytoene synthase [Novipirellula aureliae]
MTVSGDLANSEKLCRKIANSHYENFLVSRLLLPRRYRQPFVNVYAFCRTADDLADESDSPESALKQLAQFQTSLDATFAGHPPGGLFPALHQTVEDFHLDQQPFNDLLCAFRQDQLETRFRDFEELLCYCQRSANPVGRIVLRLADAASDENVAFSDKICTGLQLVNFWQDVARDFAIGRVYLPNDQMERFGVDDAMLRLPTTVAPLRQLLVSECNRAEQYFLDGQTIISRVPKWLGRNLSLFIGGGLATISAIRKIDFDVLKQRPTVSKRTQIRLVLKHFW